MGCCHSKDSDGTIVVAKQDVSVYRKVKGKLSPKHYKKGTQFVLHPENNISDWWCVRKLGAKKPGYASKYDFRPMDYSIPEEEYIWYFGDIGRGVARALLLESEGNSAGSYLVRRSDRPVKVGNEEKKVKGFVISIKTFNDKIQRNDLLNYMISRDNEEDCTGLYFINKKNSIQQNKFETIDELLKHYSHKNNAGKKLALTSNCVTSPPTSDPNFSRTLELEENIDRWNIPDVELVRDKELGHGNFGVVYLGRWRGEVPVAMKTLKVIDQDNGDSREYEKEKESFSNEMDTMKKLNHPNVVKLYGINKHKFLIIQEYCEEGDLQKYLNKFRKGNDLNTVAGRPDFDQLQEWCLEISKGMVYLHSKNIIHRDLAARNVLLNRFLTVKVADFGLSKEQKSDGDAASVTGRIPVLWSAPEVLKGGVAGKESDIWSYGVTMWEIFSFGKKPILLDDQNTKAEVLEKLNRRKRWPIPTNFLRGNEAELETMYKTMKKCWEFNPRQRVNFIEVAQDFGLYYDYGQEGNSPNRIPENPRESTFTQDHYD